ncbi:MAG: polyprenyl synthetase family protein [Firmicutes bacterium]|nr:polyprenyl synthetase family protein [Bacillota bacterium]
MALAEVLAEAAARVEAALDRYLGPGAGPPRLVEAMRYSLLGGGKRLRPFLVLSAASLCGGDPDAALPAACAVEMVHTYSLIHDDLPAMDDDDLRRGRPTNHKVFGEAMAILAGDALLTLAFEVMGEMARDPRVGPERTARAVVELARAAGPAGMVGGQVLDLEWEGRLAGAEELEAIHSRKTGALFTGCLRIGGIIAGAGPEELAALTEYARHFGLAYQIQDDILDVVGDPGVMGKAAGSDQRRDKLTYVRLYGLDGARQRAREQARLAAQALAPFGERARHLVELVEYVVARER